MSRLANAAGLRASVFIVLIFGLLAPIGAGILQTGLAALGHMPALGAIGLSLAPWQALFDQPGLWRAIQLSLFTGIGSTVIAVAISLALAASIHPGLHSRRVGRWLIAFLATPHAAIAIGLAFVLSPSGWIARLLAPLTGGQQPALWGQALDAYGLGLILGLLIKEMPFLLLMMLSALSQIPLQRYRAIGYSLGYDHATLWLKLVVPALWPLIRLPVMVVLAYALSNVDMALILGPTNPPVLAVMLMRLFADPDILLRLPASAGALLQGAMAVSAFAALLAVERLVARLGKTWIRRGQRSRWPAALAKPALGAASLMIGLGSLAILSMLLWSVAWRWSWPHWLPSQWSLQAWYGGHQALLQTLGNTLWLAAATTLMALALAIAWLEAEDRRARDRARWTEWLIYLPLLIPQIAFLQGLSVLFLRLGLNTGMLAVIWAQALFVFPYVMITLSDPWRALDPRLSRSAASLGASPIKQLLRVKLPVLLTPLLTAAALGVSVSVAQYLPTLFMGGGRVATLTTEAVTLASAADRRVTGVYTSLQAGLPLAAYALAFAIPALRRRRWRQSETISP